MDRVVHRVSTMIACNLGDKALLITNEDFLKLSTKLMDDLSTLDHVSFTSAVTQNLGWSRKKEYLKWERLFRDRFVKEVESGNFSPIYEFHGDEARRHIEDFLEVYRYSHLTIDCSISYLRDVPDEMISISLKDKRKMTDILLRRYGKEYSKLNILKSSVERLEGTPLRFVVTVAGVEYQFSPDGVR